MAKDESQGGRARREQALQLIKALGITQQQATGRDGAKVIAKKLRNNAFKVGSFPTSFDCLPLHQRHLHRV